MGENNRVLNGSANLVKGMDLKVPKNHDEVMVPTPCVDNELWYFIFYIFYQKGGAMRFRLMILFRESEKMLKQTRIYWLIGIICKTKIYYGQVRY